MSVGISGRHFCFAERLITVVIAAVLIALTAFRAEAQPIPIPPDFPTPGDLKPPGKKPLPPIPAPLCGDAGQQCCRAPAKSQNPAFGPLVSCKAGLGCDLATSTCRAPCGGVGQPCCDGPETRAMQWTPDGKVFSPTSPFLREMCDAGACDRQKHQCFICGNADGARCCPPDAAQATARCVGERLSCAFDTEGFFVSGTCHRCGIRGRAPCNDVTCDPGLGVLKGLCEACSREGQPPCDGGCQPGLANVQGVCTACGNLGQIPCSNGCRGNLGVIGSKCTECGNSGELPCNNGCRPPARLAPTGAFCIVCGALNQTPCQSGCDFSLNVAKGLCQRCGGPGQIPCDKGCDAGLAVVNQLCQRPTPDDKPICAVRDERCVANDRPGTHCCNTGEPLVCGFNFCKACVPSGNVCQLGGPQLCCQAGDVCRLDTASGNAVCGIPD